MSPQGSSNLELSGLGAKWGWFWGQASPGDNVSLSTQTRGADAVMVTRANSPACLASPW